MFPRQDAEPLELLKTLPRENQGESWACGHWTRHVPRLLRLRLREIHGVLCIPWMSLLVSVLLARGHVEAMA